MSLFTGSKTSVAFEPHCDADDGGEVDEAEAEASTDSDGEYEREDVAREGRQYYADRRH